MLGVAILGTFCLAVAVYFIVIGHLAVRDVNRAADARDAAEALAWEASR